MSQEQTFARQRAPKSASDSTQTLEVSAYRIRLIGGNGPISGAPELT